MHSRKAQENGMSVCQKITKIDLSFILIKIEEELRFVCILNIWIIHQDGTILKSDDENENRKEWENMDRRWNEGKKRWYEDW